MEEDYYYYYYYYYYLLQLIFHWVAVVLTLVTNKNKYTYSKQYKNTVETIQNTIKYKYIYYQNTHTIVKTPTHYKTHIYSICPPIIQCFFPEEWNFQQHLRGNSCLIKYLNHNVCYNSWTVKADSHIACRAHAAQMLFPCHALPLRV